MKTDANNNIKLTGCVVTNFEYSHTTAGEKFYRITIDCRRTSGTIDELPVMVSDRVCDVDDTLLGINVRIDGKIRSHDTRNGDGKRHLDVYVLADSIVPYDKKYAYDSDLNVVSLTGVLCRKPVYKQVRNQREVTDSMLSVSKGYQSQAYIPAIYWGKNANYVKDMEVGTTLRLEGRLQSRKYRRRIADDSYVGGTVIEVSTSKVFKVEEEEEKE